MSNKKLVDIPVAVLRFEKTLVRASYDDDTIQEYAEAMKRGDAFPPIIVYFDGQDHWVADGCYRCKAAVLVKRDTVSAELRRGTVQDAVVCAVACNTSHGVRRTKEDVEQAVRLLLQDEEWLKRPDSQVAAACKTNTTYVGEFRKKHNLYSKEGIILYPDGRKFSLEKIRARDKRRIETWSHKQSKRCGLKEEDAGNTFDELKVHLARATIVVSRIEDADGESTNSKRMLATLRQMKEWADNWEVWLKKKAVRA